MAAPVLPFVLKTAAGTAARMGAGRSARRVAAGIGRRGGRGSLGRTTGRQMREEVERTERAGLGARIGDFALTGGALATGTLGYQALTADTRPQQAALDTSMMLPALDGLDFNLAGAGLDDERDMLDAILTMQSGFTGPLGSQVNESRVELEGLLRDHERGIASISRRHSPSALELFAAMQSHMPR